MRPALKIWMRKDRLRFVVYVEQQRCGQRPDKGLMEHGRMTAADIDQSKVLGYRTPPQRLVGVDRAIWGVARNGCGEPRPHEHGGSTA